MLILTDPCFIYEQKKTALQSGGNPWPAMQPLREALPSSNITVWGTPLPSSSTGPVSPWGKPPAAADDEVSYGIDTIADDNFPNLMSSSGASGRGRGRVMRK